MYYFLARLHHQVGSTEGLSQFLQLFMSTLDSPTHRYFKLCMRLVLFYKISVIMTSGTHAQTQFPLPQLVINGCTNDFNQSFAYKCVSQIHLLLDLSVKRPAERECNFTYCVTSARFSNTGTGVIMHNLYARLWPFIAAIPFIYHMYL